MLHKYFTTSKSSQDLAYKSLKTVIDTYCRDVKVKEHVSILI